MNTFTDTLNNFSKQSMMCCCCCCCCRSTKRYFSVHRYWFY